MRITSEIQLHCFLDTLNLPLFDCALLLVEQLLIFADIWLVPIILLLIVAYVRLLPYIIVRWRMIRVVHLIPSFVLQFLVSTNLRILTCEQLFKSCAIR